MTLALPDVQVTGLADDPIAVLAPRHYQEGAVAAFEDAELLLSAILPEARIGHVGASAVPGAYSRGGVDVCVVVPRGGLLEALGVLGEAGYTARTDATQREQPCVLDAPEGAVRLALHVVEAGTNLDGLVGFRDALRADASLLARYNALRIAAGPQGARAYRTAKDVFIAGVSSTRAASSPSRPR
jgi:GrpB-like predicted nucleotidyltransferase (UPF0157 family)